MNKRPLLWSAWALLPALAVALHLGPGQRLFARDKAASHLRAAVAAEQAEDWLNAAAEYAAARADLPGADGSERQRLAILEAKARIQGGQLLEGSSQLETILAEEQAAASPSAETVNQVRNELATAGYFTAWLLRLEGATADEWRPETEKSRQLFRLLAESSTGDTADDFKMNLENVIRLEQMDLSDLRALPLPKKCPCNCKGLCQRKRDQRLSKCNKPGEKDAREKIKTNSAGDAMKRGDGY